MEKNAKTFIAACTADLYPKLKLSGIEFWLTASGEQTVNIEAIWSHQERKAGHGSNAMRQLCALADNLGVTLTATVHPLAYGELEDEPEEEAKHAEALDEQALDAKALEAWYARLGFCRVEGADEWNPEMCRLAQPGVQLDSKPKGASLGM